MASGMTILSLPNELLDRIAYFVSGSLQDLTIRKPNTYQHEMWQKRAQHRAQWAIDAASCRSFRLTCTIFSQLAIPINVLFHTVNLRLLRSDMPRLQSIAQNPRLAAAVRSVVLRSGLFLDGMAIPSEVEVWNNLEASTFHEQVQASVTACQAGFDRQETGFEDGTFLCAWVEALGAFRSVSNVSVDFSSDDREWKRMHASEKMAIQTNQLLYAPRTKAENSIDHFWDFALDVIRCSELPLKKLVLGETGWKMSRTATSASKVSSLSVAPTEDFSKLEILDIHIWGQDPVQQLLEPTVMELLQRARNIRNLSLHHTYACLLYTSPSPRDGLLSRMPSSA